MNRKIIVAFVTVLLITAGCSQPAFHHRPSDKTCMEWLSGERIFIEKGWFSDGYWKIEPQEFQSFSIERIDQNDDGTSIARLKFDLKAGSRGLRVEGDLHYAHVKEEKAVAIFSFTPTKVLKMGKW